MPLIFSTNLSLPPPLFRRSVPSLSLLVIPPISTFFNEHAWVRRGIILTVISNLVFKASDMDMIYNIHFCWLVKKIVGFFSSRAHWFLKQLQTVLMLFFWHILQLFWFLTDQPSWKCDKMGCLLVPLLKKEGVHFNKIKTLFLCIHMLSINCRKIEREHFS